MRISKKIILLKAALCISYTGFAASNVSETIANGDVIFKQSFKLKSDYKEEDVCAIINEWLKQSPGEFTRQNITIAQKGKPSKNKENIDDAFDNSQPVQSVDPAAKKIIVKGLTRYYGGFGSCISLLYIEYYTVFQVQGHELVATISQVKYHHYNRHSYSPQPIYSWQGGKPLDSADKFAVLAAQQETNRDMNSLNSFLNNDMSKLFLEVKEVLKKKSVLAGGA